MAPMSGQGVHSFRGERRTGGRMIPPAAPYTARLRRNSNLLRLKCGVRWVHQEHSSAHPTHSPASRDHDVLALTWITNWPDWEKENQKSREHRGPPSVQPGGPRLVAPKKNLT